MTKCYKVEPGAKMHQLAVHTKTISNLERVIYIFLFSKQLWNQMVIFLWGTYKVAGQSDHQKTTLKGL